MSDANTLADIESLPRSRRLKLATHAVHDVLDKRIMAADIFASRDRFARFLRVQYRFHRDIDALYAHVGLQALVPALDERRRLARIAEDLADLGQALPLQAAAGPGADAALPQALGWLYVAEGSNLGGIVLYKLASDRLGLGREFGARHLAAHPDGVARHWREFTAALDAVVLSASQEQQVVSGAEAAFRSVHAYVQEEMA